MAAEPEIVRGEPDGVGVGGVPPQSPVVALLQNVHVSSVMFTSKQLTIKTIQGDPMALAPCWLLLWPPSARAQAERRKIPNLCQWEGFSRLDRSRCSNSMFLVPRMSRRTT